MLFDPDVHESLVDDAWSPDRARAAEWHDGVVEHDLLASIYNPGKLALLVSWQDATAARQWTPVKAGGIQSLRHRQIRIVRDYGMFDRREAPQFHPDAKGRETRHAEPAHRGGPD